MEYKIGMNIGINGGRWGEERYKKRREFGFTHVDIDLGNDKTIIFTGTPEEQENVILNEKKLAKEAGIIIHQAHGPFRWPIQDGTVEERAERMEKMKHSIRVASKLECKNWVIHPMMPFGWQERIHNPGHEQETWDINLAFMRELLIVAKECDVIICLENMPMPDFSIGSVEEILRFVNEIDDENFKICLDTGHAAVYPGQSVGDAVRLLGDKIQVLHVHDNNGRNDNHWLPYHGVIDWEDFGKALKEINFQGVFSYETTPPGKLPDPYFDEACKMMVGVAKKIIDC